MRIVIVIIVFLQFYFSDRLSSQSLVPCNDILSKVYLIKFEYAAKTGTCFVVYHKGHEFVITAKHNLLVNGRGAETGTEVNFDIGNKFGWKKFTGILQVHENDSIDIVAVKMGFSSEINPFEISSDLDFVFNDAIILGYPFGYSTILTNNNRLIPYGKKGMISGIYTTQDMIDFFVIDILNNKGFSGGPVFVKQNNQWKLIGVVKGYFQDEQTIGDFKFMENTGLSLVTSAKYIFEIINN